MKLQDLFEAKRVKMKAGIIPYVMKNGEPLFLFMVSSDPTFGGPDPSLAKGGIDKGETPKEAAIREGSEELGLRESNMKPGTLIKIFDDLLSGNVEIYPFTVYIVEVKNKRDFDKPHYETKKTPWLTLEQFKRKGNSGHLRLVEKAYNKIMKSMSH